MVQWWWLIVVAVGVIMLMGALTSGSSYDDAMENFWEGVRYAERLAEKRDETHNPI